jgi:hypothetical protein
MTKRRSNAWAQQNMIWEMTRLNNLEEMLKKVQVQAVYNKADLLKHRGGAEVLDKLDATVKAITALMDELDGVKEGAA